MTQYIPIWDRPYGSFVALIVIPGLFILYGAYRRPQPRVAPPIPAPLMYPIRIPPD